MTFIHGFDELELIKAYGSIAFEILDQVPNIDIVVMGVGGGGLISGVSAALKLKNPNIQVIGVEPVASPSMKQSVQEGHAITLTNFVPTICAGLAPPFSGKITLEFVKKYVSDIILVSDEEVKAAVKTLVKDYKFIVEPSGAACLAALMHGKITGVEGKNVCCLLSGGNVSLADLETYTAV